VKTATDPLRIVHILDWLGTGGWHRWCGRWRPASGSRATRCPLSACSRRYTRSGPVSRRAPPSARTRCGARARLRCRAKGCQEISGDTQAQILHTNAYRPDVLAAPEGRRASVTIVTTVHGFSGDSWRDRTDEWLQRGATGRLDGVVAVSVKRPGEPSRPAPPRTSCTVSRVRGAAGRPRVQGHRTRPPTRSAGNVG
jgi:hypothetical protein